MPSQILHLSTLIAEKTKLLDDYFLKNNIPTPSFDISGPPHIRIPPTEPEAAAAHIAILDATQELNQLLSGPSVTLMSISPNDNLSLHAIYHFKIAHAIPIGEERSFEDVAQTTGLNVVDLRRILRYAMCNRIFCEPKTGYVAHTAASKLLAENKLMEDFVGLATEERFVSAPKVVEALVKYGPAQDPAETAFSLANNTPLGLYAYMTANPTRGKRWAGAMNAFAAAVPLEGLLSTFPWSSFGQATVVDVGGAWGPVSIGLAQRFPDLNFIVQDLPDVVAEGMEHVPEDLRARFEFMVYDMLEHEQPVKGAEIYFFRAIFHNWPDQCCVRILRNHVPALKKGARVVINDSCLHEPGTLPDTMERRRRAMDLDMLTYSGSREKTVADWEHILREADPRFHLRSVVQPPHDMNHILDVEWMGD